VTKKTLTALANDVRMTCQLVSRRVRYESTHELAPHQVSVLGRLARGPLTPGELADLERVSAPSITRTVNCLVDKGLITRADNPSDGRSKMLSISPEGRDVLGRVGHARDDWMVRRLAGLTADERETLRAATELLDQVMSQ